MNRIIQVPLNMISWVESLIKINNRIIKINNRIIKINNRITKIRISNNKDKAFLTLLIKRIKREDKVIPNIMDKITILNKITALIYKDKTHDKKFIR